VEKVIDTGQLPDWFDLTKYDACDNFTASEWANELRARRYEISIELTKYIPDEFRELHTYPPADYLRDRLDFHNPRHHRIPDWPATLEADGYEVNLRTGFWPFDSPTVRPIRCSEMVSAGERIDETLEYEKWDHTGYDDMQSRRRSPVAREVAYLAIDLTAPDTELEKQFRIAVREYRKKMGVPNPGKSGTTASIQKLRQYKVLAYLDLILWADMNHLEIVAEAMASALFPESVERDGRWIRERLKPWAAAAMNPGFIRTLHS